MIEHPGASSLDLTTAFAVGEADDPVGVEGLAHFVEHLWFEARVSGETVGERYRRLGCGSNAATSGEWMSFSVSCPPGALLEVLSLEADRLEPWDLDPAVLRREWGVVTVEHRERVESTWDRERTLLTRQLLPASHPVRLRATRPELGPPPTLEQVQRFVATKLRPEAATVGIVGPTPASRARDALAELYGPAKAVTELAPMRPVAAASQSLRLAPRTVKGVASRSVVHVAWSRPRPAGSVAEVVETYVELALVRAFGADPRARGVDCGGLSVLGAWSFECAVEAGDDAAAASIGAGLPPLLAALSTVGEADGVYALAEAQGALWSMAAFERRGTDQGSFSMLLALSLLGDLVPQGRPPELSRYLRDDPLDRNALVLILTGDGRPAPPPALPAVDLPLPPLRAGPTPAPEPPVGAALRVRGDGLRFAVVERADLTLAHVVVQADAEWSAEGWQAALGARPGPGQDRSGWVIELDAGAPPALARTVATTVPGLEPTLRFLKALLGRFPFDPARAASGVRQVGAELHSAFQSGASLVGWLSGAAQEPGRVVPAFDRPTAEAGVLARAMAPYAPARTGVGIASTVPRELALSAMETAFADWKVEERTPPDLPRRPPLPRALRVEVPGTQAWIGATCPLGRGDARAQVWAAVVGQRLLRELRYRRGIAYSPSAWIDGDELGLRTSVPPGEAAVAWEVVGGVFGPVSEDELAVARVEALTMRAPQRWDPDALTRALLDGTLTAEAIGRWREDVAATDVPALDALSARCRADLARVLAGPPETAWPAEATAMPVDAVERWVYGR